MDKFMIIIKKSLISMLAHLNKLYYKINLFIKKYKTINKLYEPKLNEKIRTNTLLSKEISGIKDESLKINNKIRMVSKENLALQKKITLMQEFIIKNNL